MKTLFLAVLAAVAAAAAAHASTVIEPLRARAGTPAELCTADRVWCVTAKDGAATVRHRDAGTVGTLTLEQDEDRRIESTIWRSIVRVKQQGQGEFVLVGVARTQREAYSGGGGSLTTLSLFELRPDPNVKPLSALDVPLESSFLVRACFSKEDERRRRGACHDEYRYRARLTVAPRSPNGIRLAYKAQAQSFPGPRDRFDDSAREGQLRKADLYWAKDRRCTFRRDLVRNATTGALVWNAPPPACPEYLELQ
jgi:hypothetical protein